MPASKRWKDLKREIDILRDHFLPLKFHPLGRYPNHARVQAHTRAFLVLSHAEFESYLEGWAKEIVQASEGIWKTSSKVTPPLTFLLATLAERIALPSTLQGANVKDAPQKLADTTIKVFQKFYTQVRENHGIKERNVLALFGPIGIAKSALGTTLLPNLDTLGTMRGLHAHHSKAVVAVLDPETEFKRVNNLVSDLASLDAWLISYKRRIR